MIIYDMKTEDLINPIGIDEKNRDFLGNCNRKSAVLFKPLTELLFAQTMIRFGTAVKLHLTVQSALNTTVSLYRL